MWDFFSKLWRDGLDWLGGLLGGLFGGLIRALENVASFIGNAIGRLFTELTRFLGLLLAPIIDLITGIGYLLGHILGVIVLIIQAALYLVQVLVAIGAGLMRSFAGLMTFDPATVTTTHNPYAVGTALIVDQFSRAGGDVWAAIISWAIWLGFAYGVLLLFNSMRKAG
jgi:hypothetical protein